MDVTTIEASIDQKPIFERLMQLYLHDLGEFDNTDVNEVGLFSYPYLDSYWNEPDRCPFLIYCDGRVAGLALVNRHSVAFKQGEAHSIAEFFVIRKYRGLGVGRRAAVHIFDRFPGKWEVGQMQRNVVSQQFWRKVIGEYTSDKFSETFLDTPSWNGPVQTFDNSLTGRDAAHSGS